MTQHDLSHISPVWGRSATIIADHGEGIYLHDVNGRCYMDFTSGIGVTNTGHAHPRVVKAVQDQAAKMLHAQANIVYHEPMIQLTQELSQILPPSLDSYFFSNSGAEAVEAAVKLARMATKKQNIIVFQGSFHGRTHATMSMTTSKTIYRAGYQPLVAGIFVTPFPYAYRYGWDEETAVNFCIRELKDLLKMQTAPHETAAIVIEPILGEGGYVPVPDITIMAKGLASGMPLSGIAANHTLMEKWETGSHGGTYGGNVIACAAAVATIQTMRDEKLIENSAAMGNILMTGLHHLQETHPEIGDVRGHGLMIATEFTTADGQPWGDRAKAVAMACHERDLLLLTCGAYGQTLRWIPPLVVNEEQIKAALAIFSDVL